MKKRQLGRLLSIGLSVAMAFTSAVPVYATDIDASAIESSVDDAGDSKADAEEGVTGTPSDEVTMEEVKEESSSQKETTEEGAPVEEEVEVAPEEVPENIEEQSKTLSLLKAELSDLPSAEDIASYISVATLYDKSEKNNPVIEDNNVDVIVTGNNTLTATIHGNNLKKHTLGNGMNAYLLGLAINRESLNKDGYSVKFYKGWSEPTSESEYDVYDEEGCEDTVNYPFYYGKVNPAENKIPTFYVGIRYYEGEDIAKTFVVTIENDVTLASTINVPTNIIPAKLHDTDTKAIVEDDDICDNYDIGTVKKSGNTITVPVIADNLRLHMAGNGQYGYWVGFGIPRIGGDIDQTYEQSYVSRSEHDFVPGLDGIITEETGNITYDTVYFNAADPRLVDQKGYVYVQYKDATNDETAVYTYVCDMSGVTFDTDIPAAPTGLITAKLHDETTGGLAIADADLYDNDSYKLGTPVVAENVVKVPVLISGLKKHKAGSESAGQGYWVGFGIPKVDGHKTEYKQAYNESEIEDNAFGPGLDNTMTVGTGDAAVTYDTVYFNAADSRLVDSTGYVVVRYWDSKEVDYVDYTYAFDMSGVEIDNGLPAAKTDVIEAPLVDRAEQPVETLFSDYSVTGALGEDKNTVNVSISAKELVAHTAGQGAGQGYWVGFGIPVATEDVTTEFVQSYTAITDLSAVEWKPGLDDVIRDSEGTVTYNTVYFDVNSSNPSKALLNKTGYVYVKYTAPRGDSVIYTYVVDMGGVELDGMPTIAQATGVVAPTLEDHPSGSLEKITTLYSEYKIGNVSGSNGNYTISVNAKDLRAHMNGQGHNGYWVGVGFYWPKRTDDKSNVVTKYYMSYTAPANSSTEFNSIDDDASEIPYEEEENKYLAMYYNAKDARITDNTVYAGIEYTSGSTTQRYYYTIDLSNVTTLNDYPTADQLAAIQKAPIADTSVTHAKDEAALSKGYAVSFAGKDTWYNETDDKDEEGLKVTVSADNIIKHNAGEAGEAGPGYWAGIAIPEITGKNYSVKYAQSYDIDDAYGLTWKDALDATLLDENNKITHRTVYFNAGSEAYDYGRTGYVYVKYTSARDTNDYKIYRFAVDLSKVNFNIASDVSNVIAAKLHDNAPEGIAIPDADLVKENTYAAVTSSKLDGVTPSETPYTVPVKITAKDLKQHMASEGAGYGFWVGIGLPQSLRADSGQSVKYAYSASYPDLAYSSDITWEDSSTFFDSEMIVGEGQDAVRYDTAYINAEELAGTTAKRYITVAVAEGNTLYSADSVAYIVYELDFSEITLAKTEYNVVLSETVNNLGVLIPTNTSGSITIRAHITEDATDADGKPKNAKGVPVKWISSDTNIAKVSGESYTGEDGNATATVTMEETGKASVVSISAIADSASAASLKYERYEVISAAGTALALELPGETEAVLSPTYVLPTGSEYAIEWIMTDETGTDGKAVVGFDNDGVVYALNNGTAKFAQAIIDPMSGAIVDKMGRTDRESGLLKTADGAYSVTVTTALAGASIVQNKEVYATATATDGVLTIAYAPETFDPTGVSVTWSSSNTSVAEINAETGAVTGLKKGATTIQAIIDVGGKLYKTSYVLRVKPALSGITIKKVGSDEELGVVKLKKGNVVKLVADIKADDEDADYSVTWSSDDTSVASVAPNGMVTGFGSGIAHISATAADGKTATITVKVYDLITEINTNVSNLNMAVGDEIEVYAVGIPEEIPTGLSWESSNSKVVTVSWNDETGSMMAKAVANGKAVITVKDYESGITADIKVTVGGKNVDLKGLTPVTNAYTLYVGQNSELAFTAKPANYTNTVFSWSSSDSEVAEVVNGEVTAKSVGTAKITVEAFKLTGKIGEYGVNKTEPTGIKAEYEVTVKPIPTVQSISIEPKSLTLLAPVPGIKAGESARLTAKMYPEMAPGDILWDTSDETIVSVSELDGVVKAEAPGSAVITAISGDVSQSIVVTVADSIDLADLDTGRYAEGAAWIGAIGDYTYTGAAIKPEPNVYFGSVLLTPGVDYTYSYKNNISAARTKNEPTVTVKLKGNYAGTCTATFAINPADIGYDVTVNNVSAVGKLNKKTGVYSEQLLKPVLTFNGKTLKAGTDYDLWYLDDDPNAYEAPGIWPITIVGKGNYTGEIIADEIIADPANAVNISKTKVAGIAKTYFYNGEAIIPEGMAVTYQANKNAAVVTLVEGSDYTVTFTNNVALGTATATITGTGNFFGTKKVTYKIVPDTVDLSKATITVGINGQYNEVTGTKATDVEIPYAKGGTKPSSVTVSYGGYDLTSGDFSWTNKVNAKTGIGTVTIKGKGKFYKKAATVTYKVVKQDISNLTFVADDFVYSTKAKAYEKNKITVYDLDRKALKVKTDYTIAFEAESAIPSIGSYVTATITGAGNYEGKATVTFKVIDKAYKLSAAQYSFMDDGEEIAAKKFYIKYAGSPVTITEDDIVLKIKKKVGRTANLVTIDSSEYEIVSIQNNNKVGKASVIIRGTGEYGGLKTINFTIKK